MSLRDFPDLFKHLPQHKPWVITIGVISVAMVLAVCGFGSWLLLRDEGQEIGAPTEGPSAQYRDITTREADAIPMTAANAFASREIVADPNYPPYLMLGEPQVTEDCSIAADGEVRRLLTSQGCSQMLRASFSSYDNIYFVTAGILNLPSVDVATTLSTSTQGLVGSGQGRFLGYISAPNVNEELYTAAPHLAWEVSGHFLLYTVVVRQDGADMADDETGVDVVVYDMLKTYLRDTIIEQWSIIPESSPAASTDPSGAVDPSAAAT
jgi:hypothetical protein